jgi:hypothetical protein
MAEVAMQGQLRRFVLMVIAGLAMGLLLDHTAVEAYPWQSPEKYVKDGDNHKANRTTRIYIGNWTCNLGICALPVQEVQAYANVLVTSYQYNQMVFKRSAPSLATENKFRNATINYYNTPRYEVWSWYDYMTPAPGGTITLSTGMCHVQGVCLSLYSTAYREIDIPYNVNWPSDGPWGLPTTYP